MALSMEKTHLSKKPKVFYGYWIVVAAFFSVLIFSGCGFYAFSLFVRPLQADFGWGRGEIMTAFTIFYLIMGVTAPYVGRLVDRYGAREVISVGAFIAGLGFVLLSLMHNLWHFYGGYTIIGIGMVATSQVSVTAVVSNWFKKRRGTAIGIMSTGIGAGGFVLAPLIGSYLIPTFGWRATYVALALFMWTLIPIALLVIRTKPADMGLYPDGRQGSEAVAETKASLSTTGLSPKMALATSTFWLIFISYLTLSFGQAGVLQNQVPHLEDIGFPLATAATALGIVGLMSAVGKLGFGWLCDKIQAKYVSGIGIGLQLVAIIILINVKPESSQAIIWLYAIFMGLGAGSWVPAMSMLVSANFGLVSYGAIFGAITLAYNFGTATGPLSAGYIYDITNAYYWAFILSAALQLIAIPIILAMRRPKSPQFKPATP